MDHTPAHPYSMHSWNFSHSKRLDFLLVYNAYSFFTSKRDPDTLLPYRKPAPILKSHHKPELNAPHPETPSPISAHTSQTLVTCDTLAHPCHVSQENILLGFVLACRVWSAAVQAPMIARSTTIASLAVMLPMVTEMLGSTCCPLLGCRPCGAVADHPTYLYSRSASFFCLGGTTTSL